MVLVMEEENKKWQLCRGRGLAGAWLMKQLRPGLELGGGDTDPIKDSLHTVPVRSQTESSHVSLYSNWRNRLDKVWRSGSLTEQFSILTILTIYIFFFRVVLLSIVFSDCELGVSWTICEFLTNPVTSVFPVVLSHNSCIIHLKASITCPGKSR